MFAIVMSAIAFAIDSAILLSVLVMIYFVISKYISKEKKEAFWKSIIYPSLLIIFLTIGMFVSYVNYVADCLGGGSQTISCKESYWGENKHIGFDIFKTFYDNLPKKQ